MPARTSSEPWPVETRDLYVERGCHRSATEHASFLREEMAEFITSKFWMVLPYQVVRDLPELQLSPAAVKDERDRKPRLLCDHSWYPVNETTLPHAPPEAMQFGGALHRIARTVRYSNPKYGPVYLAKHDIKDGFYRMFLRARDCPRLAIILPRYDDEEQLVAIPMSCTMGWTESPPTFSTMSETVTDITNNNVKRLGNEVKPHRLDAAASSLDDFRAAAQDRGEDDASASARLAAVSRSTATGPTPDDVTIAAPPSNKILQRPVGDTDVFVDDFLQLGQGGARRMKALRSHLLHAIDQVLAQPREDEPHRNEAVSLKKLLQGDGSWNTRKLVLGWIVDTVRQTMELPAHRKETLAQIFEQLATTKRVSAKKWASTLGKLRFVSVAIPGTAGLFSALQLAQNKAKGNRIRINTFVRQSLDAFCRLATSLCVRPTHLAEIVPQDPTLLGTTDAAKVGMGGVYFDHEANGYVWREPFCDDVRRALISADQPGGTITNSDLEQAALLGQADIMTKSHPVAYATLENLSDNTPAVSRFHKGAVSSDGAAAQLCQLASDHQRAHRYCHQTGYLPGDANCMADDASRLQHLTDAAFLHHFNQLYPQERPWRLLRLSSAFASKLTCALLCKSPSRPPRPKRTPVETGSSTNGARSVAPSDTPLPSVTSRTARPNSATSLSSAFGTGRQAKPASLSELLPWRTPYWRWARGSPTWVNRIREKKSPEDNETIPYWLLSTGPCATAMTQQDEPTPPTSPSSAGWKKPWTWNMLRTGAPIEPSSTSSSSRSSGSSVRPNTSNYATKGARTPSAYVTSTSRPTAVSTAPPTRS